MLCTHIDEQSHRKHRYMHTRTLYSNPCCHRNVTGPLRRREYLLTAMRVKAVMRRQALLLAICKLERRGLSHLPCVLYAPLLNCTAPSCCCITHIMCNRSCIDVLLYCIVHTRRHHPGSVSSRRADMYSYICCFFRDSASVACRICRLCTHSSQSDRIIASR